MFSIDSIQIRSPESFIKKNLKIFFGKDLVSGDDLFLMMIRESEEFSKIIHAIKFGDHFLICYPNNWIIDRFENYENYFLTLSMSKLKKIDSTGANPGALLYVLCRNITIIDKGVFNIVKSDDSNFNINLPYILDYTCLIFKPN